MSNTITKAATIKGLTLDENELKAINNFTIKELLSDEVFAFKLVLCDNEVDRDNECFSLACLGGLASLFVGKTIISDHEAKSENQVARIYKTEILATDKTTKSGEICSQLIAHCYMALTDTTKDLVTEIQAGIKKEVSVCCVVEAVTCSVCGVNKRKTKCDHKGGLIYDDKSCFFILDNPKDAYEVSFVAVPAQRNAGVVKNYGGIDTIKPPPEVAPIKSFKKQEMLLNAFLKSFEF